jgi:uncharacterized protein (DUF697 family)
MTITRAKRPAAPATTAAAASADEFIAAADAPAAATFAAHGERERRALGIVRKYAPWAAGAGILPVPGVDLAAVLGVQMRMLAALAKEYDVPFRQQAAKSVVATLMAAVLQNTAAGGLASAIKFVPVLGSAVGIAALPALAAAGTFAVGKVFIAHFEAGGTFLDFDPARTRAHFETEFERARR